MLTLTTPWNTIPAQRTQYCSNNGSYFKAKDPMLKAQFPQNDTLGGKNNVMCMYFFHFLVYRATVNVAQLKN